jgi:hypothetical protein
VKRASHGIHPAVLSATRGLAARSIPRWFTGHFHEKAGSCQAFFWVVSTVGLHCPGASSLSLDMRFRKPPGRAAGTQTVLPQPKRLSELFCSMPAGGVTVEAPLVLVLDAQQRRRERENDRLDHRHLAKKVHGFICPRCAFTGERRATHTNLPGLLGP